MSAGPIYLDSITDRPKGDHKDKQRRNIQSDEIWEIFFRLGSNVLPRGVGSKLKESANGIIW